RSLASSPLDRKCSSRLGRIKPSRFNRLVELAAVAPTGKCEAGLPRYRAAVSVQKPVANRGLLLRPVHSYRKASTGFRWAARRAGSQQAAKDTRSRSEITHK